MDLNDLVKCNAKQRAEIDAAFRAGVNQMFAALKRIAEDPFLDPEANAAFAREAITDKSPTLTGSITKTIEDTAMTDTLESLATELLDQKRETSKLLDLLMLVKRVIPDSAGRIDDLIFRAEQTKQCLDQSQDMINCKLIFNGCSSPDLCKTRRKCVQRSI